MAIWKITCPECEHCEEVRIDIEDFPEKEQREFMERNNITEREIETSICPFRQIIDDEPSSYCMIGDCMFDPDDEQKCGILITHLKLLALNKPTKKCMVCPSTDEVERYYLQKEKFVLNPGDGFVEYCKKHAIQNGYRIK